MSKVCSVAWCRTTYLNRADHVEWWGIISASLYISTVGLYTLAHAYKSSTIPKGSYVDRHMTSSVDVIIESDPKDIVLDMDCDTACISVVVRE
jgi:hypothetical protein